MAVEDLDALNSAPEILVGGLTFEVLNEGLANMFSLKIVPIPPAPMDMSDDAKATLSAPVFPMPPLPGPSTPGRSPGPSDA